MIQWEIYTDSKMIRLLFCLPIWHNHVLLIRNGTFRPFPSSIGLPPWGKHQAKITKMWFLKSQIHHIGHLPLQEGISPEKLNTIKFMPPKIKNYSNIMPLQNLRCAWKHSSTYLPMPKQTIFHIHICPQILLGYNTNAIHLQRQLSRWPYPVTFILGKFSDTQCNYASLVRKVFSIYMSVKILTFYPQEAECTVLCDHKPVELFLKWKKKQK